jgi:hypothetical protein
MKPMTVAEMQKIANSSPNPLAKFDELWAQNQAVLNERFQPAAETPKPVVQPVASEAKSKPVVRVGNSDERGPTRIEEREHQALEVLKALLKKADGYTDQELVAARIGGTDGPRRRRELRAKFAIDFETSTTNNVTRWALADADHARQVLAHGCAVDKN